MNRWKLVFVMAVWGSLGVFTRFIPLSALNLAFLRALIALPVLLAVMMRRGVPKVKLPQLWPYLLSGVLLGFGWLTLFYGFKHTSISSAVIIYNMCPVYVMILAPLLLKETISRVQIAVICVSFAGLFLIVGQNLLQGCNVLGLLLSAASGLMYAAIVLLNRSVKARADNRMATFVQILSAMIVLLPFVLADGTIGTVFQMDAAVILFTVLLGVLHTGVAYSVFFSLYSKMQSVEIVSYSYLEPLFGILFSVLFAGEVLTLPQIAGGVLILGSTFLGERCKGKRVKPTTSVETV